jgi:hypothetical protein
MLPTPNPPTRPDKSRSQKSDNRRVSALVRADVVRPCTECYPRSLRTKQVSRSATRKIRIQVFHDLTREPLQEFQDLPKHDHSAPSGGRVQKFPLTNLPQTSAVTNPKRIRNSETNPAASLITPDQRLGSASRGLLTGVHANITESQPLATSRGQN